MISVTVYAAMVISRSPGRKMERNNTIASGEGIILAMQISTMVATARTLAVHELVGEPLSRIPNTRTGGGMVIGNVPGEVGAGLGGEVGKDTIAPMRTTVICLRRLQASTMGTRFRLLAAAEAQRRGMV